MEDNVIPFESDYKPEDNQEKKPEGKIFSINQKNNLTREEIIDLMISFCKD